MNQDEIKKIIDQEYILACNIISDINEHVPIIKDYAEECESIIEFGVRTGVSTRALLTTDKKIRSYDIVEDPGVRHLFNLAKYIGKDVEYIIADTLKIEVDPVDMIFIDTEHTYNQLSQELRLHGNKAKKYLMFHDTVSYSGELNRAILEFLTYNKEWVVKEFRQNNNGLTILERSNAHQFYVTFKNLVDACKS